MKFGAILFPSLIVLTGFLSAADVVAHDVSVTVAPTESGIPAQVYVELGPISNDLDPNPPNGYQYVGKVTPRTSRWVQSGQVVVRWGNATSQSIRLRVPQLWPSPIKLTIFNFAQYSADKGTLDFIDRDNNKDRVSLLTRYFVARDVYGKILEPHEVKYRALRIWYDAAYNLSHLYGAIGIDDDVIKVAAQAETDARTNKVIADILNKVNQNRLNYFTDFNKQFKAVFGYEVGCIRRLSDAGYYEAANLINDHYIKELTNMSERDRSEFLSTLRINADALDKNAQYFSTRIAQRGNRPLTFPADWDSCQP